MNEKKFSGDPHREYQIEQNKEKIRELVTRIGYEEVSSMEELGLSPEQTSRLMVDRFPDRGGRAFYQAQREDGELAKAILQARQDRYVAADVFSPGLAGGRASNDDFQWDAELERILQEAKNNPSITKK
jgi:hypothetical protein